MKDLLFLQVSDKVSQVTGISVSHMLTTTTEECNDARYLLVRALAALQFTDTDIARYTHRTRQSVCYLRSHYKRSHKWTLANDWKTIRQWLENTFFQCK